MFCQKCGAENLSSAKFCKNCGEEIVQVRNQRKIKRPDKVSLAVNLLLVSLIIGLLLVPFKPSSLALYQMSPTWYFGVIIFSILFSLSFAGFFIHMIGKGRNWARITLLVLFIISVPFSAPALLRSLTINPILGIIDIGQLGLQVAAYVLLFQKPSSDWFKLMK